MNRRKHVDKQTDRRYLQGMATEQLRGTARLELDFLFESTGRGDEILTEVGVENYQRGPKFGSVGGCALSRQERDAARAAAARAIEAGEV